MNKYIMTSKGFTGQILFGYNDAGQLIFFEVQSELTLTQRDWIWKHFPTTYPGLIEIAKTNPNFFTITEMAEDLSFDRFWKEYKYKVGKKDKAEKTWNTLSEVERVKALKYINKYEVHLNTTNVNKMYPETYLNQQRWNNE